MLSILKKKNSTQCYGGSDPSWITLMVMWVVQLSVIVVVFGACGARDGAVVMVADGGDCGDKG